MSTGGLAAKQQQLKQFMCFRCLQTALLLTTPNTHQIKHLFKLCVLSIALFSISIFTLAMLSGPSVARLFDLNDTEVFRLAQEGFRIFPFSFLLCGFNIWASALFTSLSNGKVSAAISFLRTFGFLLLFLLLLPHAFGMTGVWLAVPLAELCSFTCALCFICANRKKYHYL